ncbi:MAG: DUF3592 domain-containing protein [Phycisphaerales bacterium JB065]
MFQTFLFARRLWYYTVGAGFGFLLLWVGWHTHLEYKGMAGWTEVEATIVRSGTRIVEPVIRSKERKPPNYEVDVLYTFRADHMDWVGDEIALSSEWYDSQDEAKKASLVYRPGETITVYYNPDDPRESVIDRSQGNWSIPYTIVGAIALVGCLSLLGFELWAAYEPRPKPDRTEVKARPHESSDAQFKRYR